MRHHRSLAGRMKYVGCPAVTWPYTFHGHFDQSCSLVLLASGPTGMSGCCSRTISRQA